MKKIIILLITIVVASIAMGVVTGCGVDGGESTHEHKYADAYTCHDRTCTVEGCGHVEKATTAHKFADNSLATTEPVQTAEALKRLQRSISLRMNSLATTEPAQTAEALIRLPPNIPGESGLPFASRVARKKARRRANVTIADIRKQQIFRLMDTFTPTNLPVTTEFVPLKIADI